MTTALEKLAHEVARLQAAVDIQNCMGHYETVHITSDLNWRTPECFALWREDCSVEVSDWGCIVGPEAIKAFWSSMTAEDGRGAIFWHALATPVIQVAGNGLTAKVTWMSPGFETMPVLPGDTKTEPTCYWCWGKYGMDFIKNPETGEWKIWHMKWFRTIRNNFYKSWYDDAENTLVGMPGRDGHSYPPGHHPSVFHAPYSRDKVPHPFPIDPEPYHDYDGSFRWIFGDEALEKQYGVTYPGYEALYNANYPTPV